MQTKHITLAFTGENDQAGLAACAMNLTKAVGAHAAGCYEDELGPIYMAPIDMVMPPVNYETFYNSLQEMRKQREANARKIFESAAADAGVPLVSVPSDGRPSAMWMPRDGRTNCAFEIMTDMVLTTSPGTADSFITWSILEQALFAARRRVLVVPAGVHEVTFARPMIAWNGSHEVENAVERALDIIRPGATIKVVQAGHIRPGRTPARRVVEYLQWHGFKPEFEDLGRRPVGPETALLDYATEAKADCIVMGAFTHSRTRELLFGGVTDYFLRHSHVPLLMAH